MEFFFAQNFYLPAIMFNFKGSNIMKTVTISLLKLNFSTC